MNQISAKIVLDSVSPEGVRLTTLSLVYPRIIHGEFMTHRQFSRNAMSSRAIPVAKTVDEVRNDPFIPMFWGSNKPGMQAGGEMEPEAVLRARALWVAQAADAADAAEALAWLGLHKQIANRGLEPYQWMRTVVSATEWANFFRLRCHPAAEPHLQLLALSMREAMDSSIPIERFAHRPFLTVGEAHLGDIDAELVSAARCARVSYLKHDGTACDVHDDILLAQRLAADSHASPFEHVATAGDRHEKYANFVGWRSMRYDQGL